MVKSEVVQSYADELGITMPLEYVSHSGLVASRHDPERGVHEIYLPHRATEADLEVFNPKRPFLGNSVHELCHLYLAETIDPSFSGFETSGDSSKKGIFSRVENIVVDIWVNDLFNERFPELFRDHHANYARQAEARITSKDWGELLPPTLPHSVARSQGEGMRHDLVQVDFSRLLQRSGFANRDVGSKTGESLEGFVEPELLTQFKYRTLERLWDHIRSTQGEPEAKTVSDITPIRDFILNVPTMSRDREEALALHEATVNGYAEMGRIPLTVSVVDKSPRPYWHLA